jgi:hypothetical protein
MADWLASYHENAKELYQEEEQKEQEQPKVEPKSE